MKYSIVIPTYRRFDHLLNTFYTVLNQEYAPSCIYIVDNSNCGLLQLYIRVFKKLCHTKGIQFEYIKNNGKK